MRYFLLFLLIAPSVAMAERVNVYNFVRAETDHMMRMSTEAQGLKIGQLVHLRQPTTVKNQTVIRSNQDTLYSSVIIDLSEPVTFTLPAIGGRYMSMHVINQDHYMFVETKPGSYQLTQDSVGSRFATILVRTFADVTSEEDVAKAHQAQDAIEVTGGGKGPFEAPDWNVDDLNVARKALSDFAALGFDSSFAFGRKEEVRPIDHLIGTAAGWGGLPKSAAYYLVDSVSANDGATPHRVTVKEVPVNAFWSITVYNADGYLEANDLGINSYNNFTAEASEDGSYTLHFGGCEDGRSNCIAITPGWNYAVRMYEPRTEILDGSWQFPAIVPAD